MRIWRLTSPEFAGRLDGEGARRLGGRWNSPGQAVVYCASTSSLAVLETLVHLPQEFRTPATLPPLALVEFDLPDDAPIRDLPVSPELDRMVTRTLGDGWLRGGRSLALRVISKVVPRERNILLNPAHPAIAEVRVVSVEPFRLDPRLVVDQPP